MHVTTSISLSFDEKKLDVTIEGIMTITSFDGQQSGERILYIITPHVVAKYIAITKIVIISLFFYLVIMGIGRLMPAYASVTQTLGIGLSIVLVVGSIWWNQKVFKESKTFITDRRIHRVETASPFFRTKRTLFWNEALKAKAFAPNLLYRLLNIGTVQVEPHLSDGENVIVRDVYYFEDLANYIDKILYIVKNNPNELAGVQTFVPRPRGERG